MYAKIMNTPAFMIDGTDRETVESVGEVHGVSGTDDDERADHARRATRGASMPL